jgi:hypothetical protein
LEEADNCVPSPEAPCSRPNQRRACLSEMRTSGVGLLPFSAGAAPLLATTGSGSGTAGSSSATVGSGSATAGRASATGGGSATEALAFGGPYKHPKQVLFVKVRIKNMQVLTALVLLCFPVDVLCVLAGKGFMQFICLLRPG